MLQWKSHQVYKSKTSDRFEILLSWFNVMHLQKKTNKYKNLSKYPNTFKYECLSLKKIEEKH